MIFTGLVAIFKVQLLLFLSSSPLPPLSLPAFAIPSDLTEKMGKNERKAVSKIAIITAAGLLIAFAVAGTQILTLFGITISSFMVAGGILLFIVSIELLTYGAWRFSGGTRTDTGESGVVPLAFPLLAGPGAITSV